MSEKLKAFWAKLKGVLKKISKKVYIATAVLLTILIVVIVLMANNRPYSVLFTGLNSTETSAILSYLDGMGVVDYKVQNNDTILVPTNQEAPLKAKLLMAGYPQSGFAYSYDTYYSHINSLSTESERRTTELHDLQDQMSAVVRCFDNVQDATVNISLAEDESFVLDVTTDVEASASVLVSMKNMTKLTNEQATAIRNYVAHAIQGLDIDEVYISDTMGNQYSIVDDALSGDADASALKIRLEQEWEHKVRTNVMQVLIPFFGENNVRVGVDVTVDVSQTIEDASEVTLPEYAQDGSTDGRGILASRIYDHAVIRDGEEPVGGVVGTETNADLPEYVEEMPTLDGNELEIHTSGQEDFENNHTERHIIRTAGYITDCSISVSLNAAQASAVDIQSIREHVARAAGIQGVKDETGVEYLADKVSVLAMPFYEPENDTPIVDGGSFLDKLPVPAWVVYAACGGLLLFLILLLVILRIRKKRKLKKQKQMEEEAALLAAELAAAELAATIVEPEPETTPEGGADVMTLKTEKSMELRKDIRQFAEEHPEIAAQMLRTWLKGGTENGG